MIDQKGGPNSPVLIDDSGGGLEGKGPRQSAIGVFRLRLQSAAPVTTLPAGQPYPQTSVTIGQVVVVTPSNGQSQTIQNAVRCTVWAAPLNNGSPPKSIVVSNEGTTATVAADDSLSDITQTGDPGETYVDNGATYITSVFVEALNPATGILERHEYTPTLAGPGQICVEVDLAATSKVTRAHAPN